MKDDSDINTLTMEQYLAWVKNDIRPGVVKPKIRNNIEFKINSNFMRELRHKIFKGTDDEDAHKHVWRVLEIIDLFYFPDVTHDAAMLRVFPIRLKRPALIWINRLSAGRMILKPGDAARAVPVPETFHEQTDDKLIKVEIKQMEADDQALQTILLGLPKDIYAAVDSCETMQEI
nr:hypothetical protein [Tanacetum cinerariifolium]GEX78523.1 hypothetical protein [Tanacetum cinerariifolium]